MVAPFHLGLSKSEAEILSKSMEAHAAQGHERKSFVAGLKQWARFVANVERGYSNSIYEYTNDMSVRDVIAAVMAELPPDLEQKVAKALKPWDDRFLKATVPAKRSLAQRRVSPEAIWWSRVPKKLMGELENDLRSEQMA